MARDKGQSKFSSNFEVKISEMLDPRLLVDTKEELINKETWPYDGNTIYMKEGMFVYVKGDGFYELVSLANILATDYSGWKKVTSGAEGGYDVYFSDLLDEDAIMTIISGGAYLLFDTSKVEEFIANAKGKIVLFNNKNNSSIVIPYIYFFEDSFYFSYCGVNTHNDELGIWHIQYLNGQFTLYNSAVFSDYQKKLVSGTNIKTINNTSVLGSGNISIPNNVYISKILTPQDVFNILNGNDVAVDESLVKEELSKSKGKLIIIADEDETIVVNTFVTLSGEESEEYTVYEFAYCGIGSDGDQIIKHIWYDQTTGCFRLGNGNATNRYYVTLSLTTILNGYLTLTKEQFDIIQKCAIKKYPLYIGNAVEGYRKVIYTNAMNNIIYLILIFSVNNPINIMLQISMSDYSVSWRYIPNTTIKTLTAGDGGVVTLDPNIYYYLKTSVSYIVITFSNREMAGMLNEYIFQIDGGITVTLPNTIKWQNEVTPTFKEGYTYEISVINNLACFAEFKTA